MPRAALAAGSRAAVRRYRMPAEWEPHRATWLAWPHNRSDFEIKTPAVEWCYAEMTRHLLRGERVALVVPDARVQRRARRVLERSGVDLSCVEWHRIPTNRAWIRDAGPIFVVRSPGHPAPLAATDWHFNGWARYRAWQWDDALPRRIARRLGVPRLRVETRGRPVVLEGGSIDVNGAGLLLTTEECLLDDVQARNPELSRTDLEEVFARTLGISRVLWLGRGIAGDDTHGHVDDIARFVDVRTVVAATETDRNDVNYDALRENRARLSRMHGLDGRPLRLVPLPMPRPIIFDDQRLPASYLNFYVGNRVVLVPTFNDVNDRVALSRLARLFPGRDVVGIHAVDLVLGLGAVHCLTQQEPAPVPGPTRHRWPGRSHVGRS